MTLGSSNRSWVNFSRKKVQQIKLSASLSLEKEKPDLEQLNVFKQLNE